MLRSAGVTISRLALGRRANLCTLACTSHELITRYLLVSIWLFEWWQCSPSAGMPYEIDTAVLQP